MISSNIWKQKGDLPVVLAAVLESGVSMPDSVGRAPYVTITAWQQLGLLEEFLLRSGLKTPYDDWLYMMKD